MGIISGPKDLLEDYIEAIHKLARTRLCAPHPLQYAIPVALNNENHYIKEVIQMLRRRRDILVEGLNQIPSISCVKPLGAFMPFQD